MYLIMKLLIFQKNTNKIMSIKTKYLWLREKYNNKKQKMNSLNYMIIKMKLMIIYLTNWI